MCCRRVCRLCRRRRRPARVAGRRRSCALGTLANGGSVTVTIVVTPSAAAVEQHGEGVVVDRRPRPANNSSTVSTTVNPVPATPHADLAIVKGDAPDPVVAGSNLTYTLTVNNGGPDAAAAVQVSDTLPAGVSFVSASSSAGSCSGTATVVCSLGTVANGGSVTVTIVVTPSAAGSLSNTATVSSSTDDPVSANNSSTTTTTVNPANQPPDCSTVFATPAMLWPPNHKLQLVTLLGCSDPNGDTVTVTITGVTQNEAPGTKEPDWLLAGEPNQVWLRGTERRLGGSDVHDHLRRHRRARRRRRRGRSSCRFRMTSASRQQQNHMVFDEGRCAGPHRRPGHERGLLVGVVEEAKPPGSRSPPVSSRRRPPQPLGAT